jgi:uncharacterized protein (DUF362 family)
MTWSRRRFLGYTAAAGATTFATPGLNAQETIKKTTSKSEVYVGKGAAETMLPKILDKMGGIGRFVKAGDRVMIKPNMSFANPPEWGTGTSPEAVRALVKMCLDAGAKRVIVCDNTIREAELCKTTTKIADAVKDLKGAVLYTPKQDSMYITKTDTRPKLVQTVDVVKEVYQVNSLISLCAAKSHGAGGVSLTCKGQMGLIKNRGVFHLEFELHQAIADLLYYVKPNLSIIDATRALVDNGPAGPGKVVDLATFVTGIDPVAVDSYGVSLTEWYGRKFDGKQVKHLNIASEMGFGNVESNMISEIAV